MTQDAQLACFENNVVHREEIRLVLLLGNQGEFFLNQRRNFFWNQAVVPPLRAEPGLLMKVARSCVAGWNNFLRVFVAKLVERELAGLRNLRALDEQFSRIKMPERSDWSEHSFSILFGQLTQLIDRCFVMNCGQYVL